MLLYRMKIRRLLKRITYRICRNRFYNNISHPPIITQYTSPHKYFNGVVGPSAKIVFQDGSTKEDIEVGKNFHVFGILHTQSHGKIKLGDWVTIGRNVQVRSCKNISIGSHTVIAANVIIQDNNTHPLSPRFRKVWSQMPESSDMHLWKWSNSSSIIIGDCVWIGENARICKGVSIGNNCIIGANAVVTKYVPDNSVAVGNPARIVKTDIQLIPAPVGCETFDTYIKEHGESLK